MYIKHLQAESFKGRSFNHELAPITVVVGDNFAGKSAIADALGIGLIGYDPALGKRNMDTFKLAGTSEMSLLLVTDQGHRFYHKWVSDKEGGIKYTKQQPEDLESTPVEMLSLQEYLYETTAAQRIKAIFERIDMSKFDDEAVLKKITKLADDLPARAQPVVMALCKELTASMARRDKLNETVQGWLEAQINSWKTRKKQASADSDYALGAIRAARETLNQFAIAPKDVGNQLEKARADLQTLNARMGAIEEKCSTWNKGKERRAQIEEYFRSELDGMPLVKALEKEAATLKGAISGHSDQLAALTGQREGLLAEYRAGVGALNTAEIAQKRLWNEIVAIQGAKCPCCLKVGDLCKGQGKRLRALEKEHAKAELASKHEKAELERVKKEGDLVKVKLGKEQELNAKRDRYSEVSNHLGLLRELEALGSSKQPVPQEEIDQLGAEQQALLSQIKTLEAGQAAFKHYDATRKITLEKEAESVAKQNEANTLAATIEVLIQTQEEMVQSGFNKLLQKARWFTDDILDSPLVYRQGELGRMNGNRFISHETFSGTEKLLAYAGISVALAQGAPIKLVRLDEMGRIDKDNKVKVMKRLENLVMLGNIDQALVIDVQLADYFGVIDDKVKIIEVTK